MGQLVLEDVVKRFGNAVAVAGVSLTVEDGDFTALLGPSGCGKTTLLRLVAGLERLDRGRVVIGGRDVSSQAPGERDIAMVFQRYALYPNMTVFENIAFGLRAKKMPRREIAQRVARVADVVEIGELLGRRPATLSGGQRQRVALARAISREPKVFLMDEPLSNLDTKLRTSMRAELKRLHRELGATILYVTHDQVEAMTMGTTVVVLRDGQVSQSGTPEAIYEQAANDFVATFVGSPPMNLVAGTLWTDTLGSRFERLDTSLRLPPQWARTKVRSGTQVRLGIRPEDVRLDGSGSERLGLCRVESTEPMGHETIVHLRWDEVALAARVPGQCAATMGEQVEVRVDSSRAHLFDASTGEALVSSPAGVARLASAQPN